MTPKYHVGQRVAVCTFELNIVIPATTVTDRKWTNKRRANQNGRIVSAMPGWAYLTNDCKLWLREETLRPLEDDDYKEEEEHGKAISA